MEMSNEPKEKPFTNLELTKKLKKTISIQKEQIKLVEDRFKSNEKKISVLNLTVNKMDKLLKGDLLEKAKEDAKQIHGEYYKLFTKLSVATECQFLAMDKYKYDPKMLTNLSFKIIRAFDFPDDWWKDKDKLTLGELLNTFENLTIEELFANNQLKG